MLRVVDIVEGTSVDGAGLRTAIYTAGCAHACPGCHNPETWPFDSGREVSGEELMSIVERNGFNVTFSGGDPMYQAEAIVPFARELKNRGYDIWCYTGFTFEQLLERPDALRLMRFIDVLVDGPFVENLRDPDLRFHGSSNQRIIDVQASLAAGQAIEATRYTCDPYSK
ncbi:MAG: anaerobic ribonucleoside-triphosphate reductase activating protein [Muribaculaceae bacterium]|nr:anaerobic ribonucleoside-triphosphate reductase activating protein [Muribaculaceae bacterium]